MTGRGIDQVLPHPGDPTLYEPCLRDAREYVRLAEEANGPIAQPADLAYVWGDALGEMRNAGVDVRIVNLETSITSSDDYWPDKGINYRMHPDNVGCLTAAGIDCCCLANNHVLDWGYTGLDETVRTLDAVRIARAGVGGDAVEAGSPAVLDLPGQGRVLVFSFGSTTSGIPHEWAAMQDRPGVNLLPDLSEETARRFAAKVAAVRRPGDVVVASIHWGSNWGYDVPREQFDFAHTLVEGGVDVVFGHSSHHPRPIEVSRNRPIFYGCGDLLNDYEGISGHERYRSELRLLYFLDLDPNDGQLAATRLVPFRVRRFRLERAPEDVNWIRDTLNRYGEQLGTRLIADASGGLTLEWR
jgi:poly-gamma-glutamate synthesis protein (capsule biosynthesis protein)